MLLLLYDGAVYDLGRGGPKRTSGINKEDAERLNAVQIMNAESCVYFSEWSQAKDVGRLAATHLPYKQNEVVRINEGPLVGHENSSVVHTWEAQRELNFSLPLSRLRWHAKKVSLRERATSYRREWDTWDTE